MGKWGPKIKILSVLLETLYTSFGQKAKTYFLYEVILSKLVTSVLPARPLKNYRFSTRIEFFPIGILAKYSILDVSQSSEYASDQKVIIHFIGTVIVKNKRCVFF